MFDSLIFTVFREIILAADGFGGGLRPNCDNILVVSSGSLPLI
jgi:hypothetical protein